MIYLNNSNLFLADSRFSRISGRSPFLTELFTNISPVGVLMKSSGARLKKKNKKNKPTMNHRIILAKVARHCVCVSCIIIYLFIFFNCLWPGYLYTEHQGTSNVKRNQSCSFILSLNTNITYHDFCHFFFFQVAD